MLQFDFQGDLLTLFVVNKFSEKNRFRSFTFQLMALFLRQLTDVEDQFLQVSLLFQAAEFTDFQDVIKFGLDQFSLESARDLPGLKELRAAGLLENKPPSGLMSGSDEDADEIEATKGQSELFED